MPLVARESAGEPAVNIRTDLISITGVLIAQPGVPPRLESPSGVNVRMRSNVVGLVMVAASLCLLTGCDHTHPLSYDVTTRGTVSAAVTRSAFRATDETGMGIEGRLALVHHRCLGLRSDVGDVTTVIWPVGTTLRSGPGGKAVLVSAGGAEVQLGDRIGSGTPFPNPSTLQGLERDNLVTRSSAADRALALCRPGRIIVLDDPIRVMRPDSR